MKTHSLQEMVAICNESSLKRMCKHPLFVKGCSECESHNKRVSRGLEVDIAVHRRHKFSKH
jgi:Zn finger protein HypA/HybF involved in hydrogenase expression